MGEKSMSQLVAGAVLSGGVKAGKAGQKFLHDELGYDFIGLGTKIVFFFVVAYFINKVFEAIIFGGNVLASFMALFGVKAPSSLPEQLIKFFTDGIGGFRFWDIVKVLATLLVIMEAFNYIENQKLKGLKPSPLTLGVFSVIIIGLGLITVPEIIQRLKEKQILEGFSTVGENTADSEFRTRDFR